MNEIRRDPVCGMIVLPGKAFAASHEGETVYFCSESCRDKFQEHPKRYLAAVASPHDEAKEKRRIAYFSMEVAVEPSMPTYAGGLGALAGDTLRSCADLGIPTVGVTLLSHQGYFDQKLDEHGRQQERPVQFKPEQSLRPLSSVVQVEIHRRPVSVRAWQHDIRGLNGGATVPLILLDTDVETNAESDRRLTDFLYGGDPDYRLSQEVILGIGGVRMLRALGYGGIQRFHMNEGHASFLVLELLNWLGGDEPTEWDFEGARSRSIFTTHTPVPAGHDQFDYDSVQRILGPMIPMDVLRMLGGQDRLNMTLLALNLCRYVNGVAKKHEEVSREMFPGYPIQHITNGVHSSTWTCESFTRLYDEYIPGWRNDPSMLRKALSIPGDRIWAAHMEAKTRLLDLVKQRTDRSLSAETLTIGCARRATAYKRADLMFTDIPQLLDLVKHAGPVQMVFAGKAHPQDADGKELIERIFAIAHQLRDDIAIIESRRVFRRPQSLRGWGHEQSYPVFS